MITMKSKQFHFESHDGKFYTALFSLTKVDDKEVYEFLAKEEEQKDFLHYGYITKAMAEKLLSKRERDQEIYMKSVSLKSNPKDIPQKQKIILDLPDEIDEKSFLPGGLPFQSASLTLYSKSYQEKLVPAVTIKPHSSFTLDTNESTVIFKFPNNEMECTTFMVNEFKEGTHNTIDLNVENSRAEEIIIQGVKPISSMNNETYLWIKNKERELIYVYGVLLPSNVEKKEALFNEGVSYIPISVNGAIRLYHVKIEADLNTITSCGIYSGGKIEVQDGDLAFGDAQSSIDFSSDEIDMKESYLEVKNGKTIVAQTGKDFSTLVMIEAQFLGGLTRLFTKDPSSSKKKDVQVHSLVTNSPRLHFNPNSSTSILYENKIVSDGDVAFSSKKGNALANSSLDFEGKGAELGSNEIINTTISFSSENIKSKSSKYLLTENTFVDVEIENLVASRVQKWKVRDLKATSIASGLNASLLTDGVKLEAQNLVLEKGSSLSLTVNSRKDWQCSLSNSIIKGKNMLEGKGEISIRNSVLEDATLINNNHEKKKLTISDSELKGYNTIENIKEIACSSVADSSLISSGEPKTIRDKLLEQVSNLDLFLKSENAETSVITNFDNGLEPL